MNIINFYCFFFPFIFGIFYIITLVYTSLKNKNQSDFSEGVTILISCYNEGKNIYKQLNNLVNMNYDKFEVICVNDCSKDNTYEILKSFEDKYNNIRVINNKTNMGKSRSLNHASELAKYDYLVILDGDCVITANSLKILMSNFNDDKVGIVTGNPKIVNTKKLLCKLQALEYSCIISAVKKFQQIIVESCSTASGCYFAIRKDLFNKIGKFSTTHITEDIELSYKVNKSGYKVIFEERAICNIKAIESLKGLIKQRTRWSQGGLEVLYTYLDCLFKSKMWLFIVEQILSLIWVISMLIVIVNGIINYNCSFSFAFIILLIVSNILIIAATYIDNKYKKSILRNLIYLEIIPVVYWVVSFLSGILAIPKAIKSIIKGGDSRWDTLER